MPGGQKNSRWKQYIQISAPTIECLNYLNDLRDPNDLLITLKEPAIDIAGKDEDEILDVRARFEAMGHKRWSRGKKKFVGKCGDQTMYIGKRRGISTLAAYKRKSKFTNGHVYHIEVRWKSRRLRRKGINTIDDLLDLDIAAEIDRSISMEILNNSTVHMLGALIAPDRARFSSGTSGFRYDRHSRIAYLVVRANMTHEGYLDNEKFKEALATCWGITDTKKFFINVPLTEYFQRSA